MSFKNTIIKILGGYTNKEQSDLKDEYIDSQDKITELNHKCDKLEDELILYEEERYPYNSLEEFKSVNYDLIDKKKYHKAWQNGKESYQLAHKFLKTTLEDEQLINIYLEKIYKSKPVDSDAMIFKIVKYVEGIDKYKLDKYQYGKQEYWASFNEQHDNIVVDNVLDDDCDGSAMFFYHIALAGLKKWFPNEVNKLKLHYCNVAGEWHLNNIWVSKYVNDWVVIESSIYPEKNNEFIKNPLRHQNYNYTAYVFDENGEYLLK